MDPLMYVTVHENLALKFKLLKKLSFSFSKDYFNIDQRNQQ